MQLFIEKKTEADAACQCQDTKTLYELQRAEEAGFYQVQR